MFEIIPAIDLLDGKVVRLKQGDYAQVSWYDISPVDLAKSYEAAGIQKIHIVDLDGAKEGRCVNLKTVEQIREAVSCKLELGGGLRSLESVSDLISAGIDYPILGSIIIKDLRTALSIIDRFPHQIVAGIDHKNGHLASEGWLETSALTLQAVLDTLAEHPIPYVICTNIAKDGMMQGPDTDGLVAMTQLTHFPIIASGGVSTMSDILHLKTYESQGILGCIIGKAILNNAIRLDELRSLL